MINCFACVTYFRGENSLISTPKVLSVETHQLDMVSKFELYFSSINQPTSSRYLCYVYCRTEYMPVVKFHANSSRYQGLSNMYC